MSEPKYRIVVDGHLQDHITDHGWRYSIIDDEYTSQTFDIWDAAMAEAVKLGLGRKTGESGTFELDQGVKIKAVKE